MSTFFTKKKFIVHTLGCKLNFAESSTIEKQLIDEGFVKAKKDEVPDVCIVNTCTVTEAADRKDRQAIKQLSTRYPNAFMVVIGCYAQLQPQKIGDIEGVDLILGAQNKFDIGLYLNNLQKNGETHIVHTERNDINRFFPSCTRGDRTRFWLKVQDGCDNFCSYCTVGIARGKSRNDTVENTVEQARKAVEQGAKEIVISGVNIGDFGKSTNETFYDLIKALDQIEGEYRYRISSIEPDLLTDEIIKHTAQSVHFAPHFHIPLQSGSDTILKLMHRHYDTALYAYKIATIKKFIPNAFIGVDVIVGTNGETKECFEECYQFLKQLDISQLHVFSYSERANTEALQIEYHVNASEKKRRSDLLHQLSEEKHHSFCKAQIGNEAEVLWEAKRNVLPDTSSNEIKHDKIVMHGFTANYVTVEAPYDADKINTIEKVKLTGFNETGNALVIS